MRSTFMPGDVVFLLKDITGLVEPLPTEVRERNIQNGMHYSEMLPLEYKPSEKYMEAYTTALRQYAEVTADAVTQVSEKIYSMKGNSITLVSLARAGTPVGVLIKRYLEKKYGIAVNHYALSIIRGKGIDRNAMNYILSRHAPETVQFVDGWIGKGAILHELKKELQDYPGISSELAVLSDPANLTDLCGTHEDFLIPSSCLNATVTGLVSRTFYRSDIIAPEDFHGAAYLVELKEEDLTEQYLTEIEKRFRYDTTDKILIRGTSGRTVVEKIAEHYSIRDINMIKPGIGEATRVLLRRIPWKIIVSPEYENDIELNHIHQLAAEKHVRIEKSAVDLGSYKVCGLIKNLADT